MPSGKDIEMENKILATVGGIAITEADVNEFIASLGQRGAGYNSKEGRAAVLNQLIDTKLLLLDAKRNLLEGEAGFREQLAKLKENLLVNYSVEKIIASVSSVTDKEVEEFYNSNPEQFNSGETVNASHILVESKERALEILNEINAGKSFEDCAKEYSSCPSKENGGSLGDFGRGQMVPEFDSAVFAMEPGAISEEPVKTQFGYHLIKLNSKSEAQVMPLEQVRDGIRSMLTSEKQKKTYQSKINQLKIMYPVDING